MNISPHNKALLLKLLKQGKVGVMPTDTIYGIVGLALNPKVVEKIYSLRKRSLNKPFIILISAIADLKKFDVNLTDKQLEFLQKYWPNPVSVVLPCESKKFKYLNRGTKSLAFRMPKDEEFLKLLNQTGPLVAPSANFEGGKPAETIDEARKYFKDQVSFYIDGGEIKSKPSTLVSINNQGQLTILREGSYQALHQLGSSLLSVFFPLLLFSVYLFVY